MPKGRTSSPLTIWVAPQWFQHPAVNALKDAGHLIEILAPGEPLDMPPDLILHPAAHGWNDLMWDYLPAAITAARARKKRAA